MAISPVRHELQPIKFEPVPELSIRGIGRAMRKITKLRRNPEAASFGAYVIRQGGEIASQRCVQTLRDHGLGYPQKGTFDSDKPIHRDLGKRNSPTVYRVARGSVRALMLVGADTGYITSRRLIEVTRELFDDSVLEVGVLPDPDRPLSTTLVEGDVLVFDHRQPHAFRSLTEDRLSEAEYF